MSSVDLKIYLDKPNWIFDMDGVVVDSSAAHAAAFSKTFESVGISFPDYEQFAGMATSEVIIQVLDDNKCPYKDEDIKKLTRYKQETVLEMMSKGQGISLIPHVTDVLDLATKHGKTISLVSSASQERAKIVLQTLDLTKYFQKIVTADDVAQGKPSPIPFQTLMQKRNFDERTCLVFEDSNSGIVSAKLAGASVIHYCRDQNCNNQADAIIFDFSEIIETMEKA